MQLHSSATTPFCVTESSFCFHWARGKEREKKKVKKWSVFKTGCLYVLFLHIFPTHVVVCSFFWVCSFLICLSTPLFVLLLVRGLVSTHLKFMSLVFSLSSLISHGVSLNGCTVVRWLTLSPHYEKAQVQNLARTWEPAPSPRRCLGFLQLPPSVQKHAS